MLPAKAFKRLSKNTKFWVNKSISFGPVSDPVVGNTCTYHPKDGGEWLRVNGMRTDKAGDIEIYCADEYLQSRGLWGIGGVLLHELCHAFHDQHCADGYNNEHIRKVYHYSNIFYYNRFIPLRKISSTRRIMRLCEGKSTTLSPCMGSREKTDLPRHMLVRIAWSSLQNYPWLCIGRQMTCWSTTNGFLSIENNLRSTTSPRTMYFAKCGTSRCRGECR